MLNTVGVDSSAGKEHKNQTVSWRTEADRTFLVSTVAFELSLTSIGDPRSFPLFHINNSLKRKGSYV